ncbi:MAG: VgrG-related protein [Anaerolineales bacterium]|nr:VgrG-related protein [Anaerolineales bacterium]
MPDVVTITVNGTKQEDLSLDLLELEVDTHAHLPAMFTITVDDELDLATGKLTYADADTVFKVGAEVKIELETDEIPDQVSTVKATLIIGEITAVEPVFSEDGRSVLRVRGYDRAHRLTRGKKTRTYGDANPTGAGISEDQIVKKVVQEAGLQATVDASGLTGLKYHYVMQHNQTDLEFLWSRARLYGYQVYVEDKTLYFQKADAHRGSTSQAPAPLEWGESLASFEPRLTLMHQVDRAVTTGWDPATKQAIEGTNNSDASKTIPAVGLGKKGSALAKQAFGGAADEVVVDHPVLTVDQARAIAAARFAEAESTFIQAEGVCRQGDPRLIAGRLVKIQGVGERFSGDYYVTEARHVYSKGRYRVTFTVAGRTPDTLSYLLGGHNGQDRERIYGVVTAVVVNLDDPQQLGRVQVKYPWLPKYNGAELASNWARLAVPMAGAQRGFFFTPEVDDEVLVAFDHGDPSYPYIVGALWNAKDKPPEGTKAVLSGDKKKVDQRVLRSRSGHLLIFDDTQGEEQIILQDKTGKNQLIINSKENTLTINVEKDLTITAKGKTTVKSTGAISIKSDADVSIEGKNLNLKAQSNAKLEATANIDLKATAQLNLKGMKATVQGDTMTEVKSNAMVQVQSSGMVKVAGNPIMLN